MKILFILLLAISSNLYAFGFKFHFMQQKVGIKNFGTYRVYSNATVAKSCDDYRNPTIPIRVYSGDTGDGIYRINPDNGVPFDAYCDMTSDAYGWTLIITGNMTANYLNTPASVYNGTSTEVRTFSILNGVSMNQDQLRQVIKRVPFSKIKLNGGRILTSNISTSTFSTKYTNLTGWTSTDCKVTAGGMDVTDESYGWNVSRTGAFTNNYAVLGCLVGAGSPNNNLAYIDYAYVGLGVRTQPTNATCLVQSPYGYNIACDNSSSYLVGATLHRMINSYHTYDTFSYVLYSGATGTAPGATTTKGNLIWIR